jgi:putative FmdB family regulatory protein
MPIYEFACTGCATRIDLLLAHADIDRPGPCPDCRASLRRRYSRVAARYTSWGFSRTDGLVPDRPGRADFRTIAERAERIADTGAS